MRDYQFNVGPSTAAMPTATDPTVAADLVTKSYADAHYLGFTVSQTQQTLNNNAGATAITSMITAQASYRSSWFSYTIERRTSTQGFRESGIIICEYDTFSAAWTVEKVVLKGSSGATTGVTPSIDATTGQVSLATDNMSGSTYVGNITWGLMTQFAKET